jgi:hypothetical protein
LWRWLSRAVAQGIVRQEGTGYSRDPFRYWLPEREEFLRPEGGSDEALQAWNARCVEEVFARLEQTSGANTPPQTTLPGNQEPTGVPAVTVQAEVTPLESVAPPGSGLQSAGTASPTAEPLPSQAVDPEAARRLPYPFNIMNPAEVPEEVWKQARARQQKPR